MDWESLFSMFQPQSRPDTGYQGYFDNFVNNYPAQNKDYFFNTEDPEFQRYKELSGEEPRSKGFIDDYISRRPELSDYQPSLGRKLGAFALGALSGLRSPEVAYQNAQRVRMDPYNNALTDWKAEGQNINTRALALDKAQGNELNALKLGLVERAKAAQQARLDASRVLTGANRSASSVVSGQNSADRIQNDQANRLMNILLRQQTQNALDESRRNTDFDRDRRAQLDREKFEWAKTHPNNSHDLRAQDPSEILKQDAAATSLALREIYQIPGADVFKPIIDNMRAAVQNNEDPMASIDAMQLDPKIKQYFLNTLKSIKNRYMNGGR